jgi:hypothetical protein
MELLEELPKQTSFDHIIGHGGILIFFYFGHFNQYLRNEPSQKFFSANLTLLSHVSPVGMTYNGVTSCAFFRIFYLEDQETRLVTRNIV